MADEPERPSEWNTDPGANPVDDINKLLAHIEDEHNRHTFVTSGPGPLAPPSAAGARVPGRYLEVNFNAPPPPGFSLEHLKHIVREANEELRLHHPEYASDHFDLAVRPERAEVEVLCSNLNSISFIRAGIATLAPATWHVSVRPYPTDRESVERMGAALEELDRAVR